MATQILTTDPIFRNIAGQANAANPSFLSDVVYLINQNPVLIQQIINLDIVTNNQAAISFNNGTGAGGSAYPYNYSPSTGSNSYAINIQTPISFDDSAAALNAPGAYHYESVAITETTTGPTYTSVPVTPAGYLVGNLSHEIFHASDTQLGAVLSDPNLFTADQGTAIELASEGGAAYNNAIQEFATNSGSAPLPTSLANNYTYFTVGMGLAGDGQALLNAYNDVQANGGNAASAAALTAGSNDLAVSMASAPHPGSPGLTYAQADFNDFVALGASNTVNLNGSNISAFSPLVTYTQPAGVFGALPSIGTLSSYSFDTSTIEYYTKYYGPNLFNSYSLNDLSNNNAYIGYYTPSLGGLGVLQNGPLSQPVVTPVIVSQGDLPGGTDWAVNVDFATGSGLLSVGSSKVAIPDINLSSITYGTSSVTASNNTPTAGNIQSTTLDTAGNLITEQLNQNELAIGNSQETITPIGSVTLRGCLETPSGRLSMG